MKKRNAAIDYLRVLFAVITMLHHSRYVLGDENCVFLGGSLAVEFFFIVSGYLMMESIARIEEKKAQPGLGTETAQFLWRKIRALLPEYLIAWFIGFAFVIIAEQKHAGGIWASFRSYFFELTLLKMTGLFSSGIDGVMWYVSSMILCMVILYPLVRKYPDYMKKIGAPLIAVLLMGYMMRAYGNPRNPTKWITFTYKGNLRAMAELCLGIICHEAAMRVKKLPKMNRIGRIGSAVLQAVLYLAVIRYMYISGPAERDFYYIALFMAAIAMTFGLEDQYQGVAVVFQRVNWQKAAAWAAKYSTALFFGHLYFAQHINSLLPEKKYAPDTRMIIYVALSFLNGFVVMILAETWRKNRDKIGTALHNFFFSEGAMEQIKSKIAKYWFMFEELVKRDFMQRYKRSILGMAWSVLSPLLTLLVMKVIFTEFLGKTIPHYTIYLFSGTIVLSYFKESTKQGMRSLVSNAKIFTRINVPKYLFLLSKNVSALVNFGLTILVYFVFVIFERLPFTPKMLLLIFPVICLLVMNIGIGAILSALYVFFEDIQYLYDVVLTLLTYMSAIFYSVDNFSNPRMQQAFLLNPVYVYIKYFRLIVIDGIVPSAGYHLLCLFYPVFYLSIGMWIYKKYNHQFLYYL